MIRCAAIVALVACFCAVPAGAQGGLAVAAAHPTQRALSKIDEARDMMNRYAICIAKAHGPATTRALSQPDDAAINNALRKLATDDCLVGGRLNMSEGLFRGALYRALYIREFGGPATGEALKPGNAGDTTVVPASNAFSDCVAKLAPGPSRTLVLAEPATRREQEVLAELRPTLADCLPPGKQVQLTLWGLQSTLSESLYKRTVALMDASKNSGAQ